MQGVLYVLWALTAGACAFLLTRSYVRTPPAAAVERARFGGLTLNNLLLFCDKVLVTDVDLSLLPSASALASVLVLLYGLIWETQR